MQWLQDPYQNNVDNLNNGRREAITCRHLRNEKMEHLQAKINELETVI